jgi:hypothetical protein
VVALIKRLASRPGLTALLLAYALVFGLILWTLAQLAEVSGGYGILDFEFGYTPDRVSELLTSYGPKGMALYARIQILDLFNPALYSLIAAVFVLLVWRGRAPGWVCLLPLLAGLGDYAENATLFLMVRAFPDLPTGLVQFSSLLSQIKIALLGVGMAPLVAGLVAWGWRKSRQSRQGRP